MCDKINFNEYIKTSSYDFLRNNDRLKDNIILLGLGGSWAYGTNTPSSDVDIRGIALNSKSDLIGFTNFEQFIDNNTDTVIYGFNKMISLLIANNPNTIEILGLRPEHYLMMNNIGKELYNMRHLFLSKRAGRSFAGYANQQLRRLENALCHDSYNNKDKIRHLEHTLENVIYHLNDVYEFKKYGNLKVYENDGELVTDIDLKQFKITDLRSMFSEINEIVKTYNKLNGRNNKKDNYHLNKHAMHLVRLYLMAIDIFEKEDIITYRYNDLDLLNEIRNGKYMNEDGIYSSDFFELVSDLENKFKYAEENTNLPNTPKMNVIEDFVMSINKEVIIHE